MDILIATLSSSIIKDIIEDICNRLIIFNPRYHYNNSHDVSIINIEPNIKIAIISGLSEETIGLVPDYYWATDYRTNKYLKSTGAKELNTFNDLEYVVSNYIYRKKRNNNMNNVVIIASLSQEEDIKDVKDYYLSLGYLVDYPTPQFNKSFHEIVEDYFYRISLADKVVAITKDDGSFGEGSTYELAFAKFLNKPIEIINLFEKRMGFVNVINRMKRND